MSGSFLEDSESESGLEGIPGWNRGLGERWKRAEEDKYVLVNCHQFLWVKSKEQETMPLTF